MPEKSPGVRAAVLLPADPVRLVVRPDAVEEAIDVELGEEHVVERADVLERAPRIVEERLGTGCEIPIGAIAPQRIRRAHVGEDPARVVVEEEELVGERREALLPSVAREVVRREVARRKARHHADRRADVQAERGRFLVRRTCCSRAGFVSSWRRSDAM